MSSLDPAAHRAPGPRPAPAATVAFHTKRRGAELAGKVGHRGYLWVFHSSSVLHCVLDESRSAAVIESDVACVGQGVIRGDRYSAYTKFARLHPGVLLAFCWAHQRRDFLELANAHPELSGRALAWVDEIGKLYRLCSLRLAARPSAAPNDPQRIAPGPGRDGQSARQRIG